MTTESTPRPIGADQTTRLLDEVVHEQVLACVDLDALYQLEQSLALLAGQLDRVGPDHADLPRPCSPRPAPAPDDMRRYLRAIDFLACDGCELCVPRIARLRAAAASISSGAVWFLFHHNHKTRVVPGGKSFIETCPECRRRARFDEVEVSENFGMFFVDLIGENERKYRCSGCANVFDLRDEADAPPSAVPAKSAQDLEPEQVAEQARRQAAEQARRQAAEQARRQAAEQARRQAAEKARQLAAEQRQRSAEQQRRELAEAKANQIEDELAELKKRLGRQELPQGC